ncbi:MAG: cysteine hydrolase [Paludibacteraceae bacterium]|nr:cysteine hydrolase [Paludibacteraceae bacterium]
MLKIGVIVDMQNDFVSAGGALSSESTQAVVQPVVQYFREQHFDKIYALQDTHDANYMHTQEGKYLPIKHCIAGEWGHELNDAIKTLPIDAQLCKSSFGYVNWVSFLTQEGILGHYPAGELSFTLAGVDTDICVITNALVLKSLFPEAEINVQSSLCAGSTAEGHEAAITVMRNCQINII